MIINTEAYARAGLVGNPSDGYFGKTLSMIVRNFRARVALYESPELEILPNTRDQSVFPSLKSLHQDVQRHGYYGGIRLLKATAKRFYDYCREQDIHLDDRNFTLRYHSTIPSQVGLAGSSAIITACLRALMKFYEVTIPKPIQANLILSVEDKELRIPAGLQDRVIQVYEGLVYMDFNEVQMTQYKHGDYQSIDPALLPPLYLAYRKELAEGTEVLHNDLRERWKRKDPAVLEAMKYWASLTEQARDLLLKGEGVKMGALMDMNFDKRREVCAISEGNLRMVETARRAGATATFTGSGGAIAGVYQDEAMYERLVKDLGSIGVEVLKPEVIA